MMSSSSPECSICLRISKRTQQAKASEGIEEVTSPRIDKTEAKSENRSQVESGMEERVKEVKGVKEAEYYNPLPAFCYDCCHCNLATL
ncbi:hypothetical protein PTKIN_Ptkin17bG0106200 [Pterospermum kingtungense]